MRSEIDGIVEKIYFSEGDEIVKNKKLVDISTKELGLKLKIAVADSKLADTNLKRDEKLAKNNLIPNAQLDQTI
jgi:membrane fusion protein (multidrug efflux system)